MTCNTKSESTMSIEQARTIPPAIGVLCIDMSMKLAKNFEQRYESYLPASYVKFLESAGAIVVPLWIGRPRDYYEDIMSKLNGVLIPGGAINFKSSLNYGDMTNYCVKSSLYIYEIAVDLNNRGEHFPLWGTCLGFQLMLMHSGGSERDPRQKCEKMHCALPLEFTSEHRTSILFENMTPEMKKFLETQNIGYHRHQFCITKTNMKRCLIENQWKILATNKATDGFKFVTIVEHARYPFFGWQIHLEHVCHEYLGENDPYDHCSANIKFAQYFANLFIDVCRKNNSQLSAAERDRCMIWNFSPCPTSNMGVYWKECYLFPKNIDYPIGRGDGDAKRS